MKRVKWMRAESPSSFRDIAKQLQRMTFEEGADSGFLVDRARDTSIDGRFIERMEFTETLADPFGNSQVFNRVLYKEVEFTLAKRFPELELRMPPRGVAAFMNGLMKASNFSMTIENCSVDLMRWTKAIEKSLGVRSVVRSVTATDIELAEGAIAKASVAAPKDARSGLTEILMGRKHKLSNLQVEYSSGGSPQRLMLSSDCALRYSDRLADDELEAIRNALEQVLVR